MFNHWAAGESFIYEIGITDFFNARHAVGGEAPHAHSWKIEARFGRRRYLGEHSVLDIAQIREKMRRVYAPYEDRFLNDIPPFTFQPPTIENVAAYLLEKLIREFRDADAQFLSFTIWDSPTSCITLRLKED